MKVLVVFFFFFFIEFMILYIILQVGYILVGIDTLYIGSYRYVSNIFFCKQQ